MRRMKRFLAVPVLLLCVTMVHAQRPSDPALLIPETAPPLDYVPVAQAVTLPEGMKISSLPGPADIASAFGSYESSHEVRDGKLLVARTLQLRRPRTVCTATEYAELRKFAAAVDADLRKQILYE